MSVSCECCFLLGRGVCDEPITRLEESYRAWCVCDRGICPPKLSGHEIKKIRLETKRI